MSSFQAGFIHLLGKPNVGKSTLFNALIDTPLAIATPKAQTTRNTIIGIDNQADYQAIFVDTPGYITPAYPMQQAMMKEVTGSIPGSDLCCWIVDINEPVQSDFFPAAWQKVVQPTFFLINKRDLRPQPFGAAKKAEWQRILPAHMQTVLLSALAPKDVKKLKKQLISLLPNHPPYYDQSAITDRSERFIVTEIIRKSLFLGYRKEIPYSTHVVLDALYEENNILYIEAIIYVERQTQKKILIGHQGEALKKAGTHARLEIEEILKRKVFLAQHVKVKKEWRKDLSTLSKWGV